MPAVSRNSGTGAISIGLPAPMESYNSPLIMAEPGLNYMTPDISTAAFHSRNQSSGVGS